MSDILFSSSWQSPSNIALIKYWGKYGVQMPSNASVSFTLSECRTETTLEVLPAGQGPKVELYLDGEKKDSFTPKIEKLLSKLQSEMDWIEGHRFRVKTHNTFPHSSGIASSASGMAAIALCLCDLHEQIDGNRFSDFYRRASRYARLGSGSACRSVYGGMAVWGKHEDFPHSSQEYAIRLTEGINSVFQDFQDTILLVHSASKEVSSTVGHDLMDHHPFAKKRFKVAGQNMTKMKAILSSGDVEAFIQVVESEALMLHGLMMSSLPYFILMKPNTLQIIQKIWDYRKQNGTPVLFTLDAGANVHLLYPSEYKEEVKKWIDAELSMYCENKMYICDHVGKGPSRLNP
ncbi:MAG: diphosphomevalonate decarboxylase [Bacteroidetes bacterium]|nr:diphosphomevalonate decarboxylase [Bacteroidota bacterium]